MKAEWTQGASIALHYVSGLFALFSAYYFFTSDALPFGGVVSIGSNRPKVTICGFFVVAAYLLLSSAKRRDLRKEKAIGYACLALGWVTLWLIFRGSSIGV